MRRRWARNYLLVYATNHDASNGKVEMIANNYKLTISQEGEATTVKEEGGKEKGTKPAAQGGGGPGDVLPRTVPAPRVEIIK